MSITVHLLSLYTCTYIHICNYLFLMYELSEEQNYSFLHEVRAYDITMIKLIVDWHIIMFNKNTVTLWSYFLKYNMQFHKVMNYNASHKHIFHEAHWNILVWSFVIHNLMNLHKWNLFFSTCITGIASIDGHQCSGHSRSFYLYLHVLHQELILMNTSAPVNSKHLPPAFTAQPILHISL